MTKNVKNCIVLAIQIKAPAFNIFIIAAKPANCDS